MAKKSKMITPGGKQKGGHPLLDPRKRCPAPKEPKTATTMIGKVKMAKGIAGKY